MTLTTDRHRTTDGRRTPALQQRRAAARSRARRSDLLETSVLALLTTTVALFLLNGGTTALTVGSAASRLAGQAKTPSTKTKATAKSKGTATATAKGTTAATTQRATGALVRTPYGDVRVAVVAKGSTITDVVAVHLTDANQHSRDISAAAAPVLRREALRAQSAKIDTVSGATYTSDGYRQSLQAALDQLHL